MDFFIHLLRGTIMGIFDRQISGHGEISLRMGSDPFGCETELCPINGFAPIINVHYQIEFIKTVTSFPSCTWERKF